MPRIRLKLTFSGIVLDFSRKHPDVEFRIETSWPTDGCLQMIFAVESLTTDAVLTTFDEGSDVLVVGAGNSGAELSVELAATERHVWLSGHDTGYVPLWLFNSRLFWWLIGRVFTVNTWVGGKQKEHSRTNGYPPPRLSPEDIRRVGVVRVSRVDGVGTDARYIAQQLSAETDSGRAGSRPRSRVDSRSVERP